MNPEATMTKQKTGLGHAGVLVLALAAVGSIVWSGCGGGGSATCDGYSCAPPVGQGGGSGSSSGSVGVDTDSGTTSTSTDDAATGTGTTDGSTTDGSSTADSGQTVQDAGPTCGGTLGPCPCTANTECATNQVCVAGACTAAANACEYSSQCASGDVCANGQCVASCTANECPTSYTCTKGACEPNPSGSSCTSSTQCSGSTPICAGGQCSPACGANGSCPTGDYCNQGACQVNTLPSPNCTQTSDCKGAEPQQCVAGFCEYTCTTSAQCQAIDERIDVCSPQGYCASAAEANPQCTQQSQCLPGQSCIGNVCE
jgi:hypothetical protein